MLKTYRSIAMPVLLIASVVLMSGCYTLVTYSPEEGVVEEDIARGQTYRDYEYYYDYPYYWGDYDLFYGSWYPYRYWDYPWGWGYEDRYYWYDRYDSYVPEHQQKPEPRKRDALEPRRSSRLEQREGEQPKQYKEPAELRGRSNREIREGHRAGVESRRSVEERRNYKQKSKDEEE